MTTETRIAHPLGRHRSGTSRRPAPPPPAPPSLPAAAVRALEEVETEAWADLCTGAPETIKAAAGLGLRRIGTVVAASAAAYDVLAFNRVIGRDLRAPIDARTLDRLIAHYRTLGVPRAFLPWPPPLPGARAWRELHRRGIRPYNRWIKLWRDASPPPPVSSPLKAHPIDAGDRDAFEGVLAASFDWPRPMVALWGTAIGRPGWRHFAARRHDRVVAVGGLLIRGATAWLGPAATVPEHRGAGAQKLLIHHRIEAARAAGCRLLAVETAEPIPGRGVVSFHNLRRMGFAVAYRRENYLITPCQA